MNKLICVIAVWLTMAASDIFAQSLSDDWELIGHSWLDESVKVYGNRSRTNEIPDGWTLTPIFSVYAVQVGGVSMPNGFGGLHLNTEYAHQSVLIWTLVHCREKVSSSIQTEYFSGKMMKKQDLVFLEKPNPTPEALPIIDPLVFEFVCQSKLER